MLCGLSDRVDLHITRVVLDQLVGFNNHPNLSLFLPFIQVAGEITRRLEIPTIGIGSGPDCDGQILVYHDLLGFMMHPHHAQWVPQFCKQYASVGHDIQHAIEEYRDEVKNKAFPSKEYSPYKIKGSELDSLKEMLESRDQQAGVGKARVVEESSEEIKVY